jgi:hypothetical protein
LLRRLKKKNEAEDENDNADGDAGIAYIESRPDFKIEKIGNLAKAEPVDEITDSAAQYQSDTRPDPHPIEEEPATAHDQDKRQKGSNTDEIDDGKNQGMAAKNAESGAVILDADNLEKTVVNEGFADGQMGRYPPFTELVGNDDEQRNTSEDNIPLT